MKKRRPSVTSLVVFGMIILVVYALSPGVLVVMGNQGQPLEPGPLISSLVFIWAPLTWCSENSELVGSFYEWYFELLTGPIPERELREMI